MGSKTLAVLHTCQAVFGIYNLYLASISISKLMKYEEKSKKAAEWSQTAADQLHKTRTTQASNALTIVFSLLSSAALIFYSVSSTTSIGVAGANIAALYAARVHIGHFWKGKMKIPLPGVGDYNDAISLTQEARLNMAYLMVSWAVAGGASLIL